MLLHDIYKVDNVTFDGYIGLDQDYSKHSYNFGSFRDYRYYNASDESTFIAAFKGKDQSAIPSSSSVASGAAVTVYVFIYDDPSKFTIRTNASSISLPSDPWRDTDVDGRGVKFDMCSGQPVDLTLTSPSSIRFGMDYYSNYYNISAGNSDISIMSEGEYRFFEYSSYPYNMNLTLFASFTIEYDEPPASVAGYGAAMLILGSVCIGVMLFLGRGQKIKD